MKQEEDMKKRRRRRRRRRNPYIAIFLLMSLVVGFQCFRETYCLQVKENTLPQR
jgi:hypothetical protein